MRISLLARTTALLCTALLATGLQAAEPLKKADIEAALNAAHAKYKSLQEGANADYIPALAKVDPNIFGIALVTPDGKVYHRRRRQLGGIHPVHLQGIHHGTGDGGAGA